MVAVGAYSLLKRRIVIYSSIHAQMFMVVHQCTCLAMKQYIHQLWLDVLIMTTLLLLVYYLPCRIGHAYSFPGVRADALKESVAQLAADLSLDVFVPENMASLIIDKFIIDFSGGGLSVSTVRARTDSGNSVLRQVVSVLKTHCYRNSKMLFHWRLVWDVFIWVGFVWFIGLLFLVNPTRTN